MDTEKSFILVEVFLLLFVLFCSARHLSFVGKFASPYLGKATAAARAALPLPSKRAVFSCVKTKVWLLMLGVLNKHTDIHACNCTGRLCRHRKKSVFKQSLMTSIRNLPMALIFFVPAGIVLVYCFTSFS